MRRCSSSYALAIFVFSRRWLTSGWAVIATLLAVLNLQLLWLSDALFAELPFALCTVLFLLVAERGGRRGLAALLAAAAYLLRTSGLALLVAWVAEALWHRRWAEAGIRVLLAALPVLAWQAHVSGVQQRPEYRAPAYAYQRAPYQFYNVDYPPNLAYVDAFAPERGVATAGQLVERVIANAVALAAEIGESISVRAEGPLGPVFRLNPSRAGVVAGRGRLRRDRVRRAGGARIHARRRCAARAVRRGSWRSAWRRSRPSLRSSLAI